MAPTHACPPDTPTQESAQESTVDCYPKPEPQAAALFGSSYTRTLLGFCTRHLPPYPHCPGPLLESMPPPVNRPAMAHGFAQDHPDLALIYKAVQSAGVPNYRGARHPVPHNINISAWRSRSHLFHDPSLVDMLEFGFPVGYTAPHLPASHSGNNPLGKPISGRRLCLYYKGAAAFSHHRASRPPPFSVDTLQSYDDQAKEGLCYPACDRGPLYAPRCHCQLRHPQECPGRCSI